MKKLFYISVIVLVSTLMLFVNTYGQTVTIGTGIGSNTISGYPAPYGNWDNGAKNIFTYTASEITAAGGVAGNITALAFDVSSVNACPVLMNFSISIHPQWGPFTTVYANNYQPVNGWNTHQFALPIYWDGTAFIEVETCFENSTYTENASTRWSSGSAGTYHWTSGGACNNAIGIWYNDRPNIRFTMETSTGVNEIKNPLIISVYPNPFSFETTLQSNENLKDATLTVYSLYGQQVKQIKNIYGQKVALSRDNLPSGLYFIRLTQDSQVIATKKLLITD